LRELLNRDIAPVAQQPALGARAEPRDDQQQRYGITVAASSRGPSVPS
jgi:hypothetical protein